MENPLFWCNVVLIGATILIIFVWKGTMLAGGPSDLRLRLWGMVLQLVGVYTVGYDLMATARQFGKGNPVRKTWAWIRNAFRGKRLALGTGDFRVEGDTGIMRGKRRWTLDATASMPNRIDALEKNVQAIDESLDKAYEEVDRLRGQMTERIETESAKRDAAVQEVRETMERAAAGNFASLAFGAAWLAVGIILATLAPEIVRIAAGDWRAVLRAL
jgi:hypothetical protein